MEVSPNNGTSVFGTCEDGRTGYTFLLPYHSELPRSDYSSTRTQDYGVAISPRGYLKAEVTEDTLVRLLPGV